MKTIEQLQETSMNDMTPEELRQIAEFYISKSSTHNNESMRQLRICGILRNNFSYLTETEISCIVKLCWKEATYNMVDYLEKFFPMVRAEDRGDIAGRIHWAATGVFE
jgi:hypothetical protein